MRSGAFVDQGVGSEFGQIACPVVVVHPPWPVLVVLDHPIGCSAPALAAAPIRPSPEAWLECPAGMCCYVQTSEIQV